MQNLHLQSERDTVEIWPGILNGRKGAVGGTKGRGRRTGGQVSPCLHTRGA